MPADELDRLLVAQIRRGEPGAWEECIARYEGRLQAFVESRLGNRVTSEDVVQETFLGFLISLPNYDDTTPLESFLFSIAAHKLTDVLRRNGRRPELALLLEDSNGGARAGRFRSCRLQSVSQRPNVKRPRTPRLCRCVTAADFAVVGAWRIRAAQVHRTALRARLEEQRGRRAPGDHRTRRREPQALRGREAS